jgi:hypothetical protein
MDSSDETHGQFDVQSHFQLVGNSYTRPRLLGVSFYDCPANIQPGQLLWVKRRQTNIHDDNAFEVVNQQEQRRGWLPRYTVAWFAPIMDIFPDGVRMTATVGDGPDHNTHYQLAFRVYVTPERIDEFKEVLEAAGIPRRCLVE